MEGASRLTHSSYFPKTTRQASSGQASESFRCPTSTWVSIERRRTTCSAHRNHALPSWLHGALIHYCSIQCSIDCMQVNGGCLAAGEATQKEADPCPLSARICRQQRTLRLWTTCDLTVRLSAAFCPRATPTLSPNSPSTTRSPPESTSGRPRPKKPLASTWPRHTVRPPSLRYTDQHQRPGQSWTASTFRSRRESLSWVHIRAS